MFFFSDLTSPFALKLSQTEPAIQSELLTMGDWFNYTFTSHRISKLFISLNGKRHCVLIMNVQQLGRFGISRLVTNKSSYCFLNNNLLKVLSED